LEFNQILLNISFKQIYRDLGINFTLAADTMIDDRFITDIFPTIQKNMEENYVIFDLDVMFPKNNQIDTKQFNKILFDIIDKVLPITLRENIHNNLHKYITYDSK
jgi:hypothetical protein